ncbi:hypothetical protein F5144DRAFT_549483 [Chaetomium tenue]|uniref:Uncharacterized protein n=1 Tax=Chaetomium tenue TaxID=1854479 RepID=A0ACB7P318_9PEZI|nr:hypothetical protein F5144DRAFT_549483 [Chaetomium globosum]
MNDNVGGLDLGFPNQIEGEIQGGLHLDQAELRLCVLVNIELRVRAIGTVFQRDEDGERKIPESGEPAQDTCRIENPISFLNLTVNSPEKLAAYKVTAHIADAHKAEPVNGGFILTADDAVRANFLLSASEAVGCSGGNDSNGNDNNCQLPEVKGTAMEGEEK